MADPVRLRPVGAEGGETSGESAQAPTEPGVTELPASSGAAAKPDETVVPIFDLVRVEPTGDAVIAGQGIPKAEIEILSGSSVIARERPTTPASGPSFSPIRCGPAPMT